MDFDSSDYFTYKKNKMQTQAKSKNSAVSRFNLLLQLFIATFIVIFIVIVIVIMNYSAKMDIEYKKGELSFNNIESSSSISGYNALDSDDEQRKIDKRLLLIQQEENAPSEAKIIHEQEKPENEEIIAYEHIENSQKMDKLEKIKAQNEQSEKTEPAPSKLTEMIDEVKLMAGKVAEKNTTHEDNVTITSKVLIGRFSTFEQATEMQTQIKSEDSSLTPFVRKFGDIYSVQMGSFQDFATAKSLAQRLKQIGYEVWIYQQ